LYSAEDECAVGTVDKAGLLRHWESIAGERLTTKLVQGASHAVEDPAVQVVLAKLVVDWLKEKVERG
jgi:preprotein translocase subunit Sec61beta